MMKNYKLILASGSPRRQQLLHEVGVAFTTRIVPVDEDYPASIDPDRVAEYLSEKKGRAYQSLINENELAITADTTVVVDNVLLNKPVNAADASRMLELLSDQSHRVITGVSLTSTASITTFSDTTRVFFRKLSSDEIDFYIHRYQPYDKAGGYAIQEWIGMIGIEKIEGSYFNVVGLPVEKLYQELKKITELSFV